MKKLFIAIIVALVSTVVFAQQDESEDILEKSLADIKANYENMSNGFKVKLVTSFEITRPSKNTLVIKFEIPTYSCKKECSQDNEDLLKDSIDKIPPFVAKAVALINNERKAGGISYKNSNGIITLELSKVKDKDGKYSDTDDINSFLDDAFDSMAVSDVLAAHIKLILEKESNKVLLIDKSSIISGIKIPKTELYEEAGKALGSFANFLVKMQRFNIEGRINFEEGAQITAYFKGVIKKVGKVIKGENRLFDAYVGFEDDSRDHFDLPLLDDDEEER